jgi:hypothetical protein
VPGGWHGWFTLGEQQLGQALVEAVKGDFLDQLHQFDDTFGKKVEDEVAEARFRRAVARTSRTARAAATSGVSAMPRAE